MQVELVRTTTEDGIRLDGALHVAAAARQADFGLAMYLHGVQGNFYSSTLLEALRTPLHAQGTDVLSVNTRGHDGVATVSAAFGRRYQGAAFEIVDDCRLDVQGWLKWADERGYRRVLLMGHSLGAVKALYAAAHAGLPQVAAIAAFSPPRLSYTAFVESEDRDTFLETFATAERAASDLFHAPYPTPLYITGDGYVDKYGPRERYHFLRFLARLACPILFTYGGRELTGGPAFRGIREAIHAVSADSRTQIVTIEDADHVYSGQHAALSAAFHTWLAGLPQ